MLFPLFVGVLCLYLFCYALLCVYSSFTIIMKKKRKPVALLLLSYRCIVTIIVMSLFLTVPWIGLQCVVVVFSDHTHLLFGDGCWHPDSILTLIVFQSRRFFTLARPYIKYMLHSLQIFRHISCMVSILTI